jgi:hypothetical protein
MVISDLPYLDDMAPNGAIAGGAVLGVTALALATGDATYTLTGTHTIIKTIPSGRVTLARGTGTALATGNDPYAEVSYYSEGFDKVIAKSRSKESQYFAIENFRIIAIKLPK